MAFLSGMLVGLTVGTFSVGLLLFVCRRELGAAKRERGT